MVAVFFAPGFEELEALAPVDVLCRAGVEVCTVGVGGRTVAGAHGVSVECDREAGPAFLEQLDQLEMVVLPGGMPGAQNLEDSPQVAAVLGEAARRGLWIGAICAAPFVLGHRGLLRGKRVTCYPGYETELTGAVYTGAAVEEDGRLITANGPGAALPFALRLAAALRGEAVAASLAEAMQWR